MALGWCRPVFRGSTSTGLLGGPTARCHDQLDVGSRRGRTGQAAVVCSLALQYQHVIMLTWYHGNGFRATTKKQAPARHSLSIVGALKSASLPMASKSFRASARRSSGDICWTLTSIGFSGSPDTI